jgi:hypothetical protein
MCKVARSFLSCIAWAALTPSYACCTVGADKDKCHPHVLRPSYLALDRGLDAEGFKRGTAIFERRNRTCVERAGSTRGDNLMFTWKWFFSIKPQILHQRKVVH